MVHLMMAWGSFSLGRSTASQAPEIRACRRMPSANLSALKAKVWVRRNTNGKSDFVRITVPSGIGPS